MNSFLASPYGVTPLGLLDFVSFLGSALGAGFFFLLAAADLEGFCGQSSPQPSCLSHP